MSLNEYRVRVPAHPSVYDPKPREMDIFFCVPSQGVNEETGLLFFIQGFGAHSQSRVYKKMRRIFADRYNLITVQCNYFGYEFMQEAQDFICGLDRQTIKSLFGDNIEKSCINSDDVLKRLQHTNQLDIVLMAEEKLRETPANFNDMGPMQALDCLNALLVVIEVLKDNECSFNTGRIITYGNSHGSYLAYLCNVYCPGLITQIIDNSAWLVPRYLVDGNRMETYKIGGADVRVVFRYLAPGMGLDREIRDLRFLYHDFENSAGIICYQGTGDILVNHEDKGIFIEGIKNATLVQVDESMLDGKKFKSTAHGLDADFFAMLDHSMDQFSGSCKERKDISLRDVKIKTSQAAYYFHYGSGLPVLTIDK